MPKVSIIIPTYNRAHTISSALDSLINQPVDDLEILVVDDGSTDNTRDVLSDYPQVHYVFQQNAGVSRARNTGLKLCSGETIAFLDSDDIVFPNKFSHQLSLLDQDPTLDIVYSGWQILAEDGRTVQTEYHPLPNEDPLTKMVEDGYFFPIHSALMRRHCYERVGGFDESLPAFEDPDFWIRMALAGFKFGSSPDLVCQYRMTAGSLGKNIAKLEQALPLVMEKTFNHPSLPTHLLTQKNSLFARRHLEFGIAWYELDDREDSQQVENFCRNLALAAQYDAKILAGSARLAELLAYKAVRHNPSQPEKYLADMLNHIQQRVRLSDQLKRHLRARLQVVLAFLSFQEALPGQTTRHFLSAVRLNPRWILNRGLLSITARSLLRQVKGTGTRHE
jgi:glycosyltransferase involved in cell wall biosynthesis